jgi:hypothetical protein
MKAVTQRVQDREHLRKADSRFPALEFDEKPDAYASRRSELVLA